MERKYLEVIVDGNSIGKITMRLNGSTTIVDGDNIISTGEYSHSPERIKNMVYRRVKRDHPKSQVEVNYSQNK